MTATIAPAPRIAEATPAPSTAALWTAGLAAGVVAAAATVAVAAAAHAGGVSYETEPGKAIPILGFGQLTLFFTAVGIAIAQAVGRRASRPRATLTRVTVALTALSLVPDLALSAHAATKATLMATHLVAAAIVIPVLASRLPAHQTRTARR